LLWGISLSTAQTALPEDAKVRLVHMDCSTDAEGATLGAVRCFWEDPDGFMWIGSENGLFRYDGFHLTPYYRLSEQDGPQEMGFVSSIVADGDEYLYANLNSAGVLRLHLTSFATEYFPLPKAQAEIADIYSLTVHRGKVWGATEAGLFEFDPVTGRYTYYKPMKQGDISLKSDVLYSVYPDPDHPGRLWAGSIDGLLSFDLNTRRYQSHFLEFETPRLRSEQIFGCIREYDPGQLWCSGYASGIRRLDQESGQWHNLLSDAFLQDIVSMQRMGGEVYGVHYDYGAGVVNSETRQLDYFRDPSYSTVGYEQHKYHALYLDRDSQMWIGSDAGFCRFKPEMQPVRHVFLPGRENESEFFFTAALEDMGDYYLAVTAFGHGLYKWYKSDHRVEVVPHGIFRETDTQLDIYQSLKRPDGSVDLFTRKGLWRYIPGREEVIPVNLNLVGLRARKWRDLYVVQTGINTLKYVRKGRVIRTLQLNEKGMPALDRMTSFTVADDYLWVTGNSTLVRMALPNGEPTVWQNTPQRNIFSYRHLRGLEVVGDKVVIGNNSAGFEVFECKGDSLRKVDAYYEDLAGRRPRIFSTARRGQKVYLCSSQGLIIYDAATDAVRSLDITDGLLVQNLGKTWISRVTPMEDGRVVVSGHGFFTIIDEEALKEPSPVVQIGQILQNGAPILPDEATGALQLAHDKNAFEVHYSVQPLALSTKLSYRHRLVGFDEDWLDGQDGEVRYASLPPGQYRLEIQAAADYHWKKVAALSLPVRVVPPFYQTYVFYLLCGLGILGLGAYLYRKRISYIQQQEALKSEFNKKVAELEMEALRAQMNPHFIFNALNSIEYYINAENTEDAVSYLQKFAALIRMTLQNSKQPYISLQEELASLRYYIEIEQMRLDNSFDFQLEVEEGLSATSIQIPPLLLQPYVENAIWHGLLYQQECRGQLQIQCRATGADTEIRITDNGIGRQKSAALQRQRLSSKKSMGMVITKRRMELNQAITGIQTDVSVEDLTNEKGESRGTSVVIRLRQKPKAV
jgi:ligand-binding sensor domain-containing protein